MTKTNSIPFNKICFTDQEREEIQLVISNVLARNNYIKGYYNNLLKELISKETGWKYVTLVGNCTDAIEIVLKAFNLPPGTTINTVANAGKPTITAIKNSGHIPVFEDINHKGLMDLWYGKDGINLPINLYGQVIKNELLGGTFSIVDSAQHFSPYKQFATKAVCYSFYPTKPLGCLGDGGAICTDDYELHKQCESISNYGNESCNGRNSRLDELQAAILTVRIKYYKYHDDKRKELIKSYQKIFKSSNSLSSKYVITLEDTIDSVDKYKVVPVVDEYNTEDTVHLYPILINNRDSVAKRLLVDYNIETKIHYSYLPSSYCRIPITTYYCDHILSLPIYSSLLPEQAEYIANAVIDCSKTE